MRGRRRLREADSFPRIRLPLGGRSLQLSPFAGEPIYAVIFWVACALWIGPEIIAAKAMRSRESANAQDRGSLQFVSLLWAIGIILNAFLSLRLPQARIHANRTAVFSFGIGLMLFGTAFRWYSASLLGKYFTFDVATHSGQTVVETGPYRFIRHPSYTGALLSLFGFGLALGNWAGLGAGLICLGIAYAYRIPVEERALASVLGEPYRQYLKRTWRLVPFVF
jgi:protein-S-isoprenylcysteine O-methyltransferase Ste14